MWQQIVAGVLVLAAAAYAARKLGPRRWRARAAPSAAGKAGESCGCDKGGDGCH